MLEMQQQNLPLSCLPRSRKDEKVEAVREPGGVCGHKNNIRTGLIQGDQDHGCCVSLQVAIPLWASVGAFIVTAIILSCCIVTSHATALWAR